MSVCYFGTYERNYPRNSIFLEGLRRNAVTVFECHVPLWEKTVTKGEKFGFSITFILRFFIAQFRLLFRYVFFIPKHDIIIVGYIGHLDIFLAKMIAFFGRKKLVFNPLVSLYDTVIVDRGYFTTSSLKARLMRFLDRSACKMSDVVLLDTEAHIQYFRNELDLPNINFKRLFVGADDRLFSPEQTAKPKNNFHVMFIGKFIPLHGIEKIIETAGILKSEIDIIFTLVGLGQLRSEIEKKIKEQGLNNVRLMDWIPYNQLSQKMAEADLLLGIFGDSDKAQRVIPNKLFQALAVGKPALTADTSAIRELLTPDEHIFTSEPTPDKIAEKIRFIRTHEKICHTVSINGYRFFQEKLSIEKLGAELKTILKDA